MSEHMKPEDIRFLALEGGGGKGGAFLGAIRYLEKNNILPVRPHEPEKSQIKGISGASAGAITALLLALGYEATEFEAILDASRTKPWGEKSDFAAFFDKATPGTQLVWNDKGYALANDYWFDGRNPERDLQAVGRLLKSEKTKRAVGILVDLFFDAGRPTMDKARIDRRALKALVEAVALGTATNISSLVAVVIAFAAEFSDYVPLLEYLYGVYDLKSGCEQDRVLERRLMAILGFGLQILAQARIPVIREWLAVLNLEGKDGTAKFSDDPLPYVYGLIWNSGLFVAEEPINFFAKAMTYKFDKIPALKGKDPTQVTFQEFWLIMGIDLVFTGTNVMRRRPGVFSRRHTPRMPVALAARISMGIPVLFRPVRIEAQVTKNEWVEDPSYYVGSWSDGGVLNNLPIHAFDCYPNGLDRKADIRDEKVVALDPTRTTVSPHVLGLRLTPQATEKKPGKDSKSKSVPMSGVPQPAKISRSLPMILLEVFESMGYPSEDGQLRSAPERSHTVDLPTGVLETVKLSPPWDAIEAAADEARRAIEQYFQK